MFLYFQCTILHFCDVIYTSLPYKFFEISYRSLITLVYVIFRFLFY